MLLVVMLCLAHKIPDRLREIGALAPALRRPDATRRHATSARSVGTCCSTSRTLAADHAKDCPCGQSTAPLRRTCGCPSRCAQDRQPCPAASPRFVSTVHLEAAFAWRLQPEQRVGAVLLTRMSTDPRELELPTHCRSGQGLDRQQCSGGLNRSTR